MSEPLLTCEKCGRSGFLAAGLRRHVCRPSLSAMPKLTLSPTKPIELDKVTGDQIRNSFAFDADSLGARAKAMLDHVEALKTERAQKAILVGLYCSQVKAALGHGGFNSWASRHFPKSKRTVEYYMGLAAKFARSTRLLLPELIGANQLSLALEPKDQTGAAFKAKLTKFTNGKGLTELMQQHGVIKRGGAKAPAAPRAAANVADDDAKDTPASLSPEAEAYQQMVDAVTKAEVELLDEVRWSLIGPETAAKVEPLVRRLAERFCGRLQQARHEAAA